MNMIKVRKQCCLEGDDPQDLEERLVRFRELVSAQSGTIVDIKRHLQLPAAVSIVYQLPLHSADFDPLSDASAQLRS